jgi:DNA-directed RNA polymerase specialized sigma24 family protein
MSSRPDSNAPGVFATTRWTQVLSARGGSPEARAVLSELCEAYWTPVFRFIRCAGFGEDVARDLTQGFFTQLLARDGLDTLRPGQGRFRSYLLGAVKHFLADTSDRALAAKRGGGETHVPLGTETSSTTSLQIPDPKGFVPDAFFDRQWALNLIDRALQRVLEDCARGGKTAHFEVLKPWLVGDVGELSQADAATQLGLSEGAVKVAIHRLRRQFRDQVKAEVSQTVNTTQEVQEELRYLVEVLSRASYVD